MARVFVSHATGDLALASRVAAWFDEAGHEVFLSADPTVGMSVGDAWVNRLFEELHRADALLALVTGNFVASQWCAAEVGAAVANGLRILPVRVEPDAISPLISAETTQYLAFDDETAVRASLLEALRRIDGAGTSVSPGGLVVYPGLAAFTAAQSRVFFGRSVESRRLAERLRAPVGPDGGGLLAVVGPSGCGKSSLTCAGLVPLLAADPDWLVLTPLVPAANPDANPMSELVRLLSGEGRSRGFDWTAGQVEDAVRRPGGTTRLVADLLAAASCRWMLIVVDQAEELFTRTTQPDRSQFATLLLEATGGRCRAVATVRSEFLDPLVTLAAETGLPVDTFVVSPLRREMLPLVITGPARRAGIAVDDELVARMTTDAGKGDALPLLAFVLSQLADGVERGGSLSADRYDRLGGVRGALARQADEALGAAAAVTGRQAHEVLTGLLRLVTVDEAGQISRRRAYLEDLSVAVRAEMNQFVARRLLVIHDEGTTNGGDMSGRQVVDVAHEQILDAWPPFAKVVKDAASTLRLRAAVTDAAASWERDGCPASHLWELDRARRAESELDRRDLAAVARQFLATSRRRGQLRRRRTTAILTALLMLVTAGGAAAFIQRNNAIEEKLDAVVREKRATARGLLPQSTQLLGSEPLEALRLGLAADTLASNDETRLSLQAALGAVPWIAQEADEQSPLDVAYRPDGQLLATVSDDNTSGDAVGGTLRLWDVADPYAPVELAAVVDGDESPTAVAFSPDGRTLATTTSRQHPDADGGRVRLWRLADSRAPIQIAVVDDDQSPTAVAFSSDGRTLAATSLQRGRGGEQRSDSGKLRVWDVSDPRAPSLRATIEDDQPITAVAFSPDRRTLATTSGDERVGRLRLWDVTDSRSVTLKTTIDFDETTRTETVDGVAFSADGLSLATIHTGHTGALATPSAGRLQLWDVSRPGAAQPLGGATDDQPFAGVAFGADNRTVVTVGNTFTVPGDGRMRLWDTTKPQTFGRSAVVTDDQTVSAAVFSPGGDVLATTSRVSDAAEGRLRLWEMTDEFPPVRTASIEDDLAFAAAVFSPDGRILATVSHAEEGPGGRLQLWDVTDPYAVRRVARIDGDETLNAVAFSPDGRTLAVAGLAEADSGGRLQLWDVSGTVPAKIGSAESESALSSVAFAPGGNRLATAGLGGVGLWDLTNPAAPVRIAVLAGHAMAFSPDGSTIAIIGGFDSVRVVRGQLELWDVSQPDRPTLLSKVEVEYLFQSVAFGPDGRTLATTGVGSTQVWVVSEGIGLTRISAVTEESDLTGMMFSPRGGDVVFVGSPNGASGSEWAWQVRDYSWVFEVGQNARHWACGATSGGFSELEWSEFVPEIPYQNGC